MRVSKLFVLIGMLGVGAIAPVNAQSKQERKQQTEQAVREAIDANKYKIEVNHAMPMRGNARSLTYGYSVEVRNDSLYSNLPYFGVAYSVPYSGGKGLVFNATISEYKVEQIKKGAVRISFKSRNDEDNYLYDLTVYPNGKANIQVTPNNRQSISFSGEMDLKKK